jgi:hypothetical protein
MYIAVLCEHCSLKVISSAFGYEAFNTVVQFLTWVNDTPLGLIFSLGVISQLLLPASFSHRSPSQRLPQHSFPVT